MRSIVIIIVLLSVVLFQGVLVVISGLSSVFGELSNGFNIFVDNMAKLSTVAVFFWALYLFQEQRRQKEEDTSLLRLKDLSFRLIDYVGDSKFSFNQGTANILITYLSALKQEADGKNSSQTHLKEYKLALDIVNESLKHTELKDIIGVKSEGKYNNVLEALSEQYLSIDSLTIFDPEIIERIKRENGSGVHYGISVPRGGVRLYQIEKIMAYLQEVDEEVVIEHLKRKPYELGDKHHLFPVIYAYYYFYTNSYLKLSNDMWFKHVIK
ncbi:hypothetical protein PVK62_16820 [Aliivibrio sp. S3MY1]|uniref:hypothetical protein n=1 Tax=unclassified Aliivibrio TaxID=2645654 RepID=UPI00237A048C|nr:MULTISPECIES: hypothetical protein [unclassified Aliivibrio]MDD9197490.1 hypothetical protein [Aliivibrio sp. S3MY1]MDD9200729.1 hypothetical protein [Aliivibrio sp. S2MY1]